VSNNSIWRRFPLLHNPVWSSGNRVLIGDALRGDGTLFARRDGIESAWRVVDPALQHPRPVHEYAKGSWGPAIANAFLPPPAVWHNPKEIEAFPF